jgi:hypothetical protein
MKAEQVVVAAMRTKGITKFAMLAAEPAGSIMALEAAQLSYPALDAAMVVLGSKIANDQARLISPQSLQTRLLLLWQPVTALSVCQCLEDLLGMGQHLIQVGPDQSVQPPSWAEPRRALLLPV